MVSSAAFILSFLAVTTAITPPQTRYAGGPQLRRQVMPFTNSSSISFLPGNSASLNSTISLLLPTAAGDGGANVAAGQTPTSSNTLLETGSVPFSTATIPTATTTSSSSSLSDASGAQVAAGQTSVPSTTAIFPQTSTVTEIATITILQYDFTVVITETILITIIPGIVAATFSQQIPVTVTPTSSGTTFAPVMTTVTQIVTVYAGPSGTSVQGASGNQIGFVAATTPTSAPSLALTAPTTTTTAQTITTAGSGAAQIGADNQHTTLTVTVTATQPSPATTPAAPTATTPLAPSQATNGGVVVVYVVPLVYTTTFVTTLTDRFNVNPTDGALEAAVSTVSTTITTLTTITTTTAATTTASATGTSASVRIATGAMPSAPFFVPGNGSSSVQLNATVTEPDSGSASGSGLGPANGNGNGTAVVGAGGLSNATLLGSGNGTTRAVLG